MKRAHFHWWRQYTNKQIQWKPTADHSQKFCDAITLTCLYLDRSFVNSNKVFAETFILYLNIAVVCIRLNNSITNFWFWSIKILTNAEMLTKITIRWRVSKNIPVIYLNDKYSLGRKVTKWAQSSIWNCWLDSKRTNSWA